MNKLFLALVVLLALISSSFAVSVMPKCTNGDFADCEAGCKMAEDACDSSKCKAFCYNYLECSEDVKDISGFTASCALLDLTCDDLDCDGAFEMAPTALVVAAAAVVAAVAARN